MSAPARRTRKGTTLRVVEQPMAALQSAARRLSTTDVSHSTQAVVKRLARKVEELAAQSTRVSRALRTLSAGNRTLLRERREEELLSAMCRVAVEEAGYRVAFVNYAESDDRQSVRTVTRTGQDDGFIDLLKLTWADEDRGRGSVGTAIRTGKTNVVRSMASDPRFAPWRNAAIERGLGSVASFPLRVNDSVVGTFTLIAAEEDAFDEDEVRLLEEMAADLSFGIQTIRREAQREQAEAAAKRALTHDVLVDLPNRPSFIRTVMAAIEEARRGGPPVSVVAVHVGRMQEIFDSFGYEPYRAVLREIAARLATVPVCEVALARLPMEDFGVLVPTKSTNTLGVMADRLLAVFNDPIEVGEVKLDVRAAIGVCFYPEHGEDGESLSRRASLVARDAFRKDVAFAIYTGPDERENPDRLALAGDLRAAIEGDQLELHYQPKVRIADGVCIGYEALVRWNHPSRGQVPPASFIPVAEQMGMIAPLTNTVIKMAVLQLHKWDSHGGGLPVAVNLSARNLYDPNLVTTVERWLKAYSLPGGLLHFEITEGALVDDPHSAKQTLNKLRALGSSIYIDDFGTGYSSLSYLATLPINALKIDRSFVREMGSSRQARSVVASIISMAHNLDMRVVAEGVETQEQLATLTDLGCDKAQGYFFGRPMPAESIQVLSQGSVSGATREGERHS